GARPLVSASRANGLFADGPLGAFPGVERRRRWRRRRRWQPYRFLLLSAVDRRPASAAPEPDRFLLLSGVGTARRARHSRLAYRPTMVIRLCLPADHDQIRFAAIVAHAGKQRAMIMGAR